MADFMLTVGIDVGASIGDIRSDINNLISQINSSPPKIKVKLDIDTAELDSIRNMTINAGKITGAGGVAAGFDASGTKITNRQLKANAKTFKYWTESYEGMEKAIKNGSNVAMFFDEMNKAQSRRTTKPTADRAFERQAAEYYNALRQVNTLQTRVSEGQKKWTAAKKGSTAQAYSDLSIYSDELSNLRSRLISGSITTKQFKDEMAALSLGVSNSSTTIKDAGKATMSWGDKITTLSTKFGTWFTVSQAVMTGVRVAKNMVKNVVDLDSSMTELKKVTNESDETYNKFLDTATTRSKKLGATLTDTVDATASFARLGYGLEDAQKLADAAIIYKSVGDIANIEDASQSIISTMQAFKVKPEEVMNIVDKFNAVGNSFAISSEGIGDSMLNSASAMEAAGNTLDETIALTTAANTVVQDPKKVGTTLKTVSMYLRASETEAKKAGESTDGMAKSVSELRKEILQLTGNKVDIQIDKDNYKSTYQILEELSGVWGQLSDISKANVLELVGGKRNSNIVAAILENFDVAEDALKVSLGSEGSAMEEHEKVLSSIQGRLNVLKSSWQEFSTNFISTDLVKGVVSAGSKILEVLNGIITSGKKMTATLGATAGVVGLVKGAPLVAALAPIAAIGLAINEYKEYTNDKKTAANLSKTTKNIEEHTDKFLKLKELMSEVEKLELVINSPESTQAELDSAQQRIQEIATMLNKEYDLHINADVDDLKDVTTLLTIGEKNNIMDEVDSSIDIIKSSDYKTAKTNIESSQQQEDRISKARKKLGSLISEYEIVSGYSDESQKRTALAEVKSRFKGFFSEYKDIIGAHVLNIQEETWSKWGAASMEIEQRYQEASTKNSIYKEAISNVEESSKKAADNLAQVLAAEMLADDQYGARTTQAKMKSFGETLKQEGADINYLGQKFAVARQGFFSFDEAVKNNSLGAVVNDFISFKTSLGDSVEDAVKYGALLSQGFTEPTQITRDSIASIYKDMETLGKSHGIEDFTNNALNNTSILASGFSSLSEVVEAGDAGVEKYMSVLKDLAKHTEVINDKMTPERQAQLIMQTADKMGVLDELIPKDKTLTIDKDGGVHVLTKKLVDINKEWGSKKGVTVDVSESESSQDISDYESKLDALDGKKCVIEFDANGEPLEAKIDEAGFKLSNFDEETYTVTLTAEDGKAVGVIDLVSKKIELLPDVKEIEIVATASTGVDDQGGLEGLSQITEVIGDKTDLQFKLDVDGDVEVIDRVGNVLTEIASNENIALKINTETGGLDVLNKQSPFYVTIQPDGKISEQKMYAQGTERYNAGDKFTPKWTAPEYSGAINDFEKKINELHGKEVTLTINADGTGQATIDGINYSLDNYDNKDHSVELTMEGADEATAKLNLIDQSLSLIPDKKVIDLQASSFEVNNGEGIKYIFSKLMEESGAQDLNFKINANTEGIEVLSEAGDVISELRKNDNIEFYINADGNLEMFEKTSETIYELKQDGTIDFVMNFSGGAEGFKKLQQFRELWGKGDNQKSVSLKIDTSGEDTLNTVNQKLIELNGQSCTVNFDVNAGEGTATIGNTVYTLQNFNGQTYTATLTANTGEAVAQINLLTGQITSVPDKNVNVDAHVSGESDVDNLNTTISGINSKEVTVSATTSGESALERLRGLIDGIKSKAVSVVARIFGGSNVDGTAHADGTAFANGRQGDWGTSGSGVALGGELGQELIVRDGKFFTIGDDSAEFFTYQKDDIIFNADQTEQIFEKGKITHGKRRGRAFAEGTSKHTPNNGLVEYWEEMVDTILRTNPTANDFTGIEEASKKAEHVFGANLGKAQTNFMMTHEAMSDRNNITYTDLALDSIKNADLSEAKDIVDIYRTWYNSVWDAIDAENAKKKEESDKRAAEAIKAANPDKESFFDWSEVLLSLTSDEIASYKDNMQNKYLSYQDRMSAADYQRWYIGESKKIGEEAYARYIQQADSVGLDEYHASRVRNGTIDIESVSDENLKKRISDYQKWYERARSVSKALEEINTLSAQVYEDEFAAISSKFDSIVDYSEQKSSIIQGLMDIAEAEGMVASDRYYRAMATEAYDMVGQLEQKRTELIEALNRGVQSGEIIEYTEAWYLLQKEINSTTEAINSANLSAIDFTKKMDEIRWGRFDYAQSAISELTKESDFLIELLGDDLYEENGEFNKKGIAAMGLHGLNYNTYMEQAISYSKELKDIDAKIASEGSNNSLIERKRELLELQRESILAAEDEKSAIVDMVEEGIDVELEALQELIDKYTESLDSAQDLYEYQQKVADQTSDIATIKKQLAAYANDTSEETKAIVQKLQTDLKDAQKNLESTERDRHTSNQKELLDSLYENYETLLNGRLDDVDTLISENISAVNSNAKNINTTLKTEAQKVGATLSPELKAIWTNSNNALKTYLGTGSSMSSFFLSANGFFENSWVNSPTGLQSTLGSILQGVNSLVKNAVGTSIRATDLDSYREEMKSNSIKWLSTDDSSVQSDLAAKNEEMGELIGLTKNNGVWYDTDGSEFYTISDEEKIRAIIEKMKMNSARWSTDLSIIDRKKLEDANAKLAAEIQELTGRNVHRENGVWWIDDQELYAYKQGGLVDFTGAAWLDGSPSKPEMVLNSKDTSNFIALRDTLRSLSEQMISAGSNGYPNAGAINHLNKLIDASNMLALSNQGGAGKSIGEVNINIPIEHVDNYNDFITQLQHDNQFEKLVQSMSIDLLDGKSSLIKNKFRW